MAYGLDSYGIGLQYTQLLSLVHAFAIPWPPVLRVFHSWITIVNFDVRLCSPSPWLAASALCPRSCDAHCPQQVDFVTPSCLFDFSYFLAWNLTMLLPVLTGVVQYARWKYFGLQA